MNMKDFYNIQMKKINKITMTCLNKIKKLLNYLKWKNRYLLYIFI